MVHSLDLFPENSKKKKKKRKKKNRYGLGVFVWLLFNSQEMIVGRRYVQLAAIWHWYLPLCIYITFFKFVLCLFIPFFYVSL